jgi:hypothetical protein
LGLPYDRPAQLVRDYLDVLMAAFAGPGAVDVDKDNYRVHSPIDITDSFETPVLLAALGPTMLPMALGGDATTRSESRRRTQDFLVSVSLD